MYSSTPTHCPKACLFSSVLGGQKISGADIRDQNGGVMPHGPSVYAIADQPLVVATQAISNVVKSSFGPSGLDKMMVDDIGVRRATEASSRAMADED